MEKLRRAILTILCGLVLSLAYVSPAAAQTIDLGKPLLLVAAPGLSGFYGRTVLIAVPVKDEHFGFILNRSMGMKMTQLFPDHLPSAKVVDPIYLGGPQLPEALFALLRHDPGKPSLRLLTDLFVISTRGLIDKVIEETPNEARYFTGFVGWRRGELASELKSGYWYALDADADAVFHGAPDAMWEEFLQKAQMSRDGI
ncbi:TPA: hypothetical protein DIV48_00195 [Candidatus Kaiserbacteria bacterium]|nr:MAG: hypothetical protein UY93_C0002G0204 [Parcubacteria group bacterium GW2011_GWA1_56_13]KKW46744.1 MAG: hypothetical protein UY97_C0003G0018 [Parcubacteria group bacterium GW2011_GWB1_57_6]HCR52053.1 hypothetical protein [Candidatus Kaiserbacteria bacterium]